MMRLRVLIVDDESPSREEMRFLLKQIDSVDIAGEASNGSEVITKISAENIDLVFLDIHMPGVSGLDISRIVGRIKNRPLIVFATAFDTHALEAFDCEAFDYILKPFTIERVKKVVERAAAFLDMRTAEQKTVQTGDKKIPLYCDERIIPTSPKHIIFAKCCNEKLLVQTMQGRYTSRLTMAELEERLCPYGFIRTHRSSLVNTNHVLEVIPWFNGSYKLVMNDKDKTEVDVSRQNSAELKKHFEL
jgi:two-component system, LytTR family, response regulator LytT